MSLEFGSVLSNTAMYSKAHCGGLVTMAALEGPHAVVFPDAMPSVNYHVFLQVETDNDSVVWPSDKTTAGFNLNMSGSTGGPVAWLAIED